MKHLVIIAHGSRHEQSNDEVRELAGKIAARKDHGFDSADYAFLEPTQVTPRSACTAWSAWKTFSSYCSQE